MNLNGLIKFSSDVENRFVIQWTEIVSCKPNSLGNGDHVKNS